jgi:hypothetical protein
MSHLTILLLIALNLLGAKSQSSTVSYKSLTLDVTVNNPERGFYIHTEVFSTGAYESLDPYYLSTFKSKNMTLLLRNFYLEAFVKSPISANYLSAMQTDFDRVRQAGLKCIVRFSYSNDNSATVVWDATKAQVLAHITQLTPVLKNNIDVIAVVQAGFVGVWG